MSYDLYEIYTVMKILEEPSKDFHVFTYSMKNATANVGSTNQHFGDQNCWGFWRLF